MELSKNMQQPCAKIGGFDKVAIIFTDVNSADLGNDDALTPEKKTLERIEIALPQILSELAQELTDTAYSQQSQSVNLRDEAEKLKRELILREIEFVSKDQILLTLKAPTQYPDYFINCELNENLKIEECTLD